MRNQTALLVIDLQNDYFEGGKFPLWSPDLCQQKLLDTIARCRELSIPVILVQHVATSNLAPFFVPGSTGVEITAAIRQAAPDAPVIVKRFADSFYHTELETVLQSLKIQKLWIAGMMTHNCVTFTALSKAAEKYEPKVLTDCCTTVSEMLHLIALNALSIRVPLSTAAEAFAALE